MKKKNLIIIIMVFAMVLSLAACGPGTSPDAGNGAPPGAGSDQAPGSDSSDGTDTGRDVPDDNSATGSPDSGSEGSENNAGSGGADNSTEQPSSSPDSGKSSGNGGNGDNGNDNGSENGSNHGAGGNGAGGSGSLGSSEDVLSRLIDDLNNAGVTMPMSMPPAEAPLAERHNAIGLSDDDYARYVIDDAQSIAGISTFAHQIIIYQCVDEDAAVQVRRLVAGDGGYNPQKWICVFPEIAVAVNAGNYVLLVASYREVADAAVESFRSSVGSTGEVVIFYEGV